MQRHRGGANRIGSTIFASRRSIFYQKKSSIARDERPQSPPATFVNDHGRNGRQDMPLQRLTAALWPHAAR
jgi:hypothetical protein